MFFAASEAPHLAPRTRSSCHNAQRRAATCVRAQPPAQQPAPTYLFGTNEEGRKAPPPTNAWERFFYECALTEQRRGRAITLTPAPASSSRRPSRTSGRAACRPSPTPSSRSAHSVLRTVCSQCAAQGFAAHSVLRTGAQEVEVGSRFAAAARARVCPTIGSCYCCAENGHIVHYLGASSGDSGRSRG